MPGWYIPQDQEAQIALLRNQADFLSESLANIQQQIEALEEEKKS